MVDDCRKIEVVPPFVDPDRVVDVYPLGDLRQHVVGDRGKCWCHPEIECTGDGGWIVVHNSMDGREQFETGARRAS